MGNIRDAIDVATLAHKYRAKIRAGLSGVTMDDLEFSAARLWKDPDGTGMFADFTVRNCTRKRLKLLQVLVSHHPIHPVLGTITTTCESKNCAILGSPFLSAGDSVDMRATFANTPDGGCVVAVKQWKARRWWWPIAHGDCATPVMRDFIAIVHDDRKQV